jgi:putative dimethyl sulfoxide reductase chaperone
MKKILPLKEEEKQALIDGIRKLSDIFWGPDPQKCADIWKGSYWNPFEIMIPRLNSESVSALNTIKAWVNSFSDIEALGDDLEETYVRLFISDRQGIKTPLYASCYEGEGFGETTPLMGEPAQAMKQRYLSKGLSLAEDIGEPPDHLSIELEYLYFLLEKGWADKDDLLLEEAFSFGSEIMFPWVQKFEKRLVALETENHFYPLHTTLLCSILQLIDKLNQRP